MEIWGNEINKKELLSHLGDIRQIAGVTSVDLADGPERGVRALRMRNAAGLDLMVVVDRGMSIGDLSFQGIPLAFSTGLGYSHPASAEPWGFGWLRSFPGGFLTTCGLTQVGSPCEVNGELLGLHGRIGTSPAHHVQWGEEWNGEKLMISVSGEVTEGRMFHEKLVLKRTINMDLVTAAFSVDDEVENMGFTPAPFMFLQHINLGFPLLSRHTILELPEHTTLARDPAAKAKLDECLLFSAPVPGCDETVFTHSLVQDEKGWVKVRLVNPKLGDRQLAMTIRYPKKDYPNLMEWKMMRAGNYVVGLEPANCHVEGQSQERNNGTLVTLQPGEISLHHLEFSFSVS